MKEIEINGTIYCEKIINKKSEYSVVRTNSAGVFAGIISKREGQEGVVKNARRLWYWSGAASLSELSVKGVRNPGECKFPCPVDEVILTEIIEILPMTEEAIESIYSVPEWKA